jgi:hypothetical protein
MLSATRIITWADSKNDTFLKELEKSDLHKPANIIVCIDPKDKVHFFNRGYHLIACFAFNRQHYQPKEEFYRVYDTNYVVPGKMTLLKRTIYFYFYMLGVNREARSLGLRNNK